MVECIFTLDYEIYGNGTGSVRELMHEPARRLKAIFEEHGARFVLFVEVAELELIERYGTDSALDLITSQVREFRRDGFELGLHMHPWWYNAKYESGQWVLDYGEYNLCVLPQERIACMVDRSLAHLRKVVGEPAFTPVSFRAGHLLFQPTQVAARALSDRGIKIDSSVFRGGVWRQHQQDYRRTPKHRYYWRFGASAAVSDPRGALVEIPIHTRMVPSWKMLTGKRLGLERKTSSIRQTGKKVLSRLNDFARFRRPLKLDFCTMTSDELAATVEGVLREDRNDPAAFRPIVAIGHSKELVDFDTVSSFLSFLKRKSIGVSTFEDVYHRCSC
jgi:hypothetical protein